MLLLYHHQVYISQQSRHRIRKIDRHGIISTIAGTGKRGFSGDGQLAIHAQLYCPQGLYVTEESLFTRMKCTFVSHCKSDINPPRNNFCARSKLNSLD